ncbi:MULTISPECIES: hypothetical protein [unclassified Sphingomonas]|uniref:gp53-like domain-containing protein n=1 Tax=unclassified Sphingomonas TaxID=196159 RepID=UPI00226AED24|nr:MULTISPECIES: hypothetical protein [unclassified Sphingomonas]
MTPSITLTMTEAGFARFTAAQLGQGIDLKVTSIGVTNTPFISAPTLTVMPGEIKRIQTVSGAKVGDNTVHLMIRDDSSDIYSAVGVGLYLADGTLFAFYGQATPIFQKSALTTFLVALDISFPDASINAITFGDANFLNPPATSDTAGVVQLATLAQAQGGTDTTRAIVPAVLAAMLLPINTAITALQNAAGIVSTALSALLARTITGGGLVSGGGDHTASRVLTVTAATADQAAAGTDATTAVTPASLATILTTIAAKVPQARKVATSGLLSGGGPLTGDLALSILKATAATIAAGTDDASAVTPAGLASLPKLAAKSGFLTLPGGIIIQWTAGSSQAAGSEGTQTITHPIAFPNNAWRAFVTTNLAASTSSGDAFFQTIGEPSLGSSVVQRQITGNPSDSSASTPVLFVIGN